MVWFNCTWIDNRYLKAQIDICSINSPLQLFFLFVCLFHCNELSSKPWKLHFGSKHRFSKKDEWWAFVVSKTDWRHYLSYGEIGVFRLTALRAIVCGLELPVHLK